MTTKNITKLTSVLRSKNAGPFELTFDMIFHNREIYRHVKASNVITRELIMQLYQITEDKIITFEYFDAANALKITLVRPRPEASVGEIDMHGCQQHVPLLSIEIPFADGNISEWLHSGMLTQTEPVAKVEPVDIDDVILNVAGVMLGYAVFALLARFADKNALAR